MVDVPRVPSAATAGPLFGRLYRVLAASPAHTSAGRLVYGDGFAGQLGYAGDEELRALGQAIGVVPGELVLDLCCGTGGLASRFAEITGARTVGVDCARPPAAGKAAGTTVVGDANSLPFRAGAFSGLICVDGFSNDPAGLVRESRRVLQPGGRAAFLLSLPREQLADFFGHLGEAGFLQLQVEDRGERSVILLERLAGAYRRERRRHRREIGPRRHDELVREVLDVLAGIREGSLVRSLIAATSPGAR